MSARLCPTIVLAIALFAATVAAGQTGRPAAPFLFLNQERILTGSQPGQALLADEDAARDALRAEAAEIDRRFEAEERRLTDLRAGMDPDEFRTLADTFDDEVVAARLEQDDRSAALLRELDQRRRQFFAQVAPILVDLLERYGAHAIFDESSVLLADQTLNITDVVIAEIDARAAEPDAGAAPDAELAPEPAEE